MEEGRTVIKHDDAHCAWGALQISEPGNLLGDLRLGMFVCMVIYD